MGRHRLFSCLLVFVLRVTPLYCFEHSKKKQVDFCFVTFVASDARNPLVNVQKRLLEKLSKEANWTYVHRTFSCRNMCTEDYRLLHIKTYVLFRDALTWTPRCRSVVKMDADGFLCGNFFAAQVGAEGMAALERTYAGGFLDRAILDWPSGHRLNLPWRKATSEVALRQWTPVVYAAGAGYLVGRQVMQFVVRHPISELLNIMWEDMSVGIWTNAMESRRVVLLSKSLTECRRNATVVHRCDSTTMLSACSEPTQPGKLPLRKGSPITLHSAPQWLRRSRWSEVPTAAADEA